jgi:hypothetical protein
MSNRFYCAILWAMILSEVVSYGWAQLGTQGAIVGVVTDSSDAAVSGAAVTVQNIETGLKLSAVTNDSGIFEVLALPVGYYSVTITFRGFRPWTLERTQLTVGERKRLEFRPVAVERIDSASRDSLRIKKFPAEQGGFSSKSR